MESVMQTLPVSLGAEAQMKEPRCVFKLRKNNGSEEERVPLTWPPLPPPIPNTPPPHPTLLLRLGPDSSDTTDLFWLTHTKKEIGDTCGYCVPLLLLLLHKHLPHLRISLQFGVLRLTDERKSVLDGRVVRFPLRFETIKDRLRFCFMLLL